MLHEMPDNEMNDGIFCDLTQISHIPPSHSINNRYYYEKFRNFEISSEHNHTMKSIEEILESVPKSYSRKSYYIHAHLLMKYLFRKAVPNRISSRTNMES